MLTKRPARYKTQLLRLGHEWAMNGNRARLARNAANCYR